MPDPNIFPPSTAPAGSGPRRIDPAAPQSRSRGRRGSNRGWIVAATLAVTGVLAALGVTGFVIAKNGSQSASETQVRTAVDSFVTALGAGDLPALQSGTCGTLADFYRGIPTAEFADVHRDAVTQGNLPVVTSIDAVQITDNSAIVEVTAHPQANPVDASPRTFDLERVDGAWKVCDPE